MKKLKAFGLSIACMTLMFAIISAPAGAESWNAYAGWSDTSNPSPSPEVPTWTYGKLSGDNWTWYTYSFHEDNWNTGELGAGTPAWRDPDPFPWWEAVAKSTASTPQTKYDLPNGSLILYNSGITWTAPRATTVNILGGVWNGIDRDLPSRNNEVRLVVKGTLLFDLEIPDRNTGVTSANPFTFEQAIVAAGGNASDLQNIAVSAGDTIVVDVTDFTGMGDLAGVNFAVSEPSAGGDISGTVTDSVTAAPIAGAVVRLIGTANSVTTGADGKYVFTDLAPQGYTLSITKLGYMMKRATSVTPPATQDFALGPLKGMDWAKSAFASANVNEGTAELVNDGDAANTGWRPATVQVGDWVMLTWSDPLTVGTVLVNSRLPGNEANQPGLDYFVESSMNGTDWNELRHVSVTEAPHVRWIEIIHLPSPVVMKYLRVRLNCEDAKVGPLTSIECFKPDRIVTGLLKDAASVPVAGAYVYACESIDGNRGPISITWKAVTGLDGSYNLLLPTGTFMVIAAPVDGIGAQSAQLESGPVPDLTIGNRASGSPSYVDNFDSVPNGSTNPLLETFMGTPPIGSNGKMLAQVAGLPPSASTIKDLSSIDCVLDIDTNWSSSALIARYVNWNGPVLMLAWPSWLKGIYIHEVHGGIWDMGPKIVCPVIDERQGHLHVVVAGNQMQGFLSDRWNTYWTPPYTLLYNLGTGKMGFYNDSPGFNQLLDNLVVGGLSARDTVVSPGNAKERGAGWIGSVKGIVTAMFSDYREFILEAEDRSSAIAVVAGNVDSLGLSLGKEVVVFGALRSDGKFDGGLLPDLTLTGRTVDLRPLGMANKNLAGVVGVGLANTNLLVKVWGKVLHTPATFADGNMVFHITDGTAMAGGPTVEVPIPGYPQAPADSVQVIIPPSVAVAGVTLPADGDYVDVGGIASEGLATIGSIRAVRIRGASDLRSIPQ
ncbi:MAG: carboxypeptidase regulatory-like domain-containing protein [Armatimonadetes bacterium]|nr:carboxypeptidase regulatory-like domain-containing protein [Armatimonadota bacterium]